MSVLSWGTHGTCDAESDSDQNDSDNETLVWDATGRTTIDNSTPDACVHMLRQSLATSASDSSASSCGGSLVSRTMLPGVHQVRACDYL